MTAAAEEIFEQALALPERQRAALIEALADSIVVVEQDDDLSPEWKAEISRRIEAIEDGSSRLVPGDEVQARIRAVLARVG